MPETDVYASMASRDMFRTLSSTLSSTPSLLRWLDFMAPRTTIRRADAILPMTDDYVQQIVGKEKNYEFRRYRINSDVRRIWFYLNAPNSHISFVCEVDSARTRQPGDEPLVEDGLGNKEFNKRDPEWDGYDFAYRIRSVRRLPTPITLANMKSKHGIKGAPRSLVYVPESMLSAWRCSDMETIWATDTRFEAKPAETDAKRKLSNGDESPRRGCKRRVRAVYLSCRLSRNAHM